MALTAPAVDGRIDVGVASPDARPVRGPLGFWARLRSGDLRPAGDLLLLVTFLLTPVQLERIGPHVTLADVTLVLAGATLLLSAHRWRPVDTVVKPRLALGFALMAAGGIVGLILAGTEAATPIIPPGASDALSDFARNAYSPTSASSIELLARLAGVAVLCFVVLLGGDPTPRLLRRCATVYVLSASVSSVIGTAAAASSSYFSEFESGVGRATGLAGNANIFGVVTAIGAVFAAVLASLSPDRRARVLFTVAVVVQVLGIAYSGSRGAMVGVTVGLVLVAVRLARTGHVRAVLAAVVVGALFLVVTVSGLVRVPTIDRMLLRTDTTASSLSVESTDVRIELFSRALDDRGIESLVVGSGLREQPATSVHNGHFEVWLGLGAVGFVGWLVVCALTCLPALRTAWRRDRLDEREGVRFAFSAGFVAFVVTALTVNNIWNRYLWLIVAVVAYLGTSRPPGASWPADPARRGVRVGQLMALSFFLMPLVSIRLTKTVAGADVPLALAAGLVVLWGPFGRRPDRLAPRLLVLGAALLALGAVVSLGFSGTPLDSGVLHGRLLVTMVMCWVTIAWWDPDWRAVHRLLVAFIAGAALSGGLGAFSAITRFGFAEPWRDVANQTDRATGLAGNANHLGVYCALALVMACVLAAHERRWWPYALAIVPLVAGILWCGSRSGMVAVVVAMMFLAVHVVRMGKGRWVAAIAGAALLVFVLGVASLVRVPVIDRVLLRTDTAESRFSQVSTDARLNLAHERLDEVGTHGLIVGDGMVNRSTTGPHSGHLEIWVGLGLIGLAGWALIALSTVWPAFRLTWSKRRLAGHDLALYAVALTFVSHMVLASFLEHIWTRYIWLLVGLSAVLASPYPAEEEDAGLGDGADGASSDDAPDEGGAGDGNRTRVIRMET